MRNSTNFMLQASARLTNSDKLIQPSQIPRLAATDTGILLAGKATLPLAGKATLLPADKATRIRLQEPCLRLTMVLVDNSLRIKTQIHRPAGGMAPVYSNMLHILLRTL